MRRVAALLLALVCFAASAEPTTYYVAKNKNGGRIVLTFTPCPALPDKEFFYMYANAGTGQMIEGCWTLALGQVHVVYQDGTRFVYDPAGFTKMGSGNPAGPAL